MTPIASSSPHHNHSSQLKLRSLLGKCERQRHPKWQKKNWKCPIQAKWGPGLDLSKRTKKTSWVSNNILWQPTTFPGHVCLSQVCLPPPDKDVKETETAYRINAEAKRAVRKVWERKRGVGRTLTKSPRLLALIASNTLTSSSTKCYWKGKIPNVFKSSPGLLPTCHITLSDVYGRAQRPHFWRKKNKNKPQCSWRREEGAEGCWGLSHIGLCSVKQLPSSSLAQF